MRIELPSPSWADTALRADDDAHTLTVAAPARTDWLSGGWQADPALTLRTEIAKAETLVLTLTF